MTPKSHFQSTITNLLNARKALNNSLRSGRSDRWARDYSVQGLYLIGVRSFEAFLEDQIHALATKKEKWQSRHVGGSRVVCYNRLMEQRPELVRLLILAGKEYTDYLPYERTEKIAELLFRGGKPFTLLTGNDKTTLRRCQRVRNYIAHPSKSARAKFMTDYKLIKPIRIAKPTPSHYLEDQIRVGVTFFEHDLSQLAAISNFLS